MSLHTAASGSSGPGFHSKPALTPPLPLQAATIENTAEPLETPGHPEESRAQVDPAAGRDPEKTYNTGSIAPHAGLQQHGGPASQEPVDAAHPYLLMQPVYSKEYVESVVPRHKPPKTVRQCHACC